MNFRKLSLALLSVVLVMPLCQAAVAVRHYKPPRAEEALARPVPFPEDKRQDDLEADRVRYSVLIGLHDYATLEHEAGVLMQAYSAGRISGDEFDAHFDSMAPLKAGETAIADLKAWTQARPRSYAAWYVLARQYYQLARDARGGKVAAETSRQRYAQMHQYAAQAWAAFNTSLPLYARPLPSYVRMIALEKLSGPYPFGQIRTRGRVCDLLHSYLHLDPALCRPTDQALMDAVLQAAIRVDPDNVDMYSTYFAFGVPRWGGDFKHLYALYEAAQRSGRMHASNLAELKAQLLWWAGVEAVFFRNDYHEAAQMEIKAYEANPGANHLGRLYNAASEALSGGDKEEALRIYSRIISIRPTEYLALFQRAEISEELHGDHERLFEDLIPSALLGYVYAQNNIGYYYMTGSLGFPVDLQQARKWLTLAANQGYQHSRDKLPIVDAMIARQAAGRQGTP